MASKVLHINVLEGEVQKARAAGRTVALANGVFDLWHVGHVRYLQAAKRLADLLVVAVNSDASARRLKGPGRPLLPDRERAEMVAALSCVDFVTVFDEDDVRGLIRRLRPHLQVKGTDYAPDTVPERDAMAEVGGRVVVAGGPKVRSSTDLVEGIRAGRGRPA